MDFPATYDWTTPSMLVVVVVVMAPDGWVRVSVVVRFTSPSGVRLVSVTRLTSVVPPVPDSVKSVTLRPMPRRPGSTSPASGCR